MNLNSGLRVTRLGYRLDPDGYCAAGVEEIVVSLNGEDYYLFGSICESSTDEYIDDLRAIYNSFRSR